MEPGNANNFWSVDAWFGAGNHLPALAALAPEFPVTGFDQFVKGKTWIFLHKIQQAMWREWYYGNMQGMFRGEADAVNANDLWPNGNVTATNWFRYYVDTYVAAHIGDGFEAHSPLASEQEWIDEYADDLRRAYCEALASGYVQGKFGLMVIDDTVMSVDTLYHFPVVSPWNKQSLIGHLLVYPYFEDDGSARFQPSDYYRQANHARVFKYGVDECGVQSGINTVETYGFVGATPVIEAKIQYPPVGTIGEMKAAPGQSPLQYVGVSDGYSRFPLLAPTVRQLIACDTVQSIIVGMNAFFDTVLPSDQTKLEDVREEMYDSRGDSIGGAGEIAGGVNRRLFARSARGNIFSEDGDTKGITRNLPYEGALDKIHLVYATLLERFHALSKIPPAIMGVNAGKGESAQAREDLMLGIQSELATDRVKCSKILKDAIRAASGMPMKDLNVDWLKLPYENTPQYSAPGSGRNSSWG